MLDKELHLNLKEKHYFGVKGWVKIFQSNRPKKQEVITILVSNKIDFKLKSIKKNREGYFMRITGKIQ